MLALGVLRTKHNFRGSCIPLVKGSRHVQAQHNDLHNVVL